MISGVVVTGSLAAATASVKLLPPSSAFWTLSTRSSIAALALVGVELGRDFGLRLLQRLAAARLDRIDLHHDPAEVGLDRADDGALTPRRTPQSAALSPATPA